jgi:hypothetical protein
MNRRSGITVYCAVAGAALAAAATAPGATEQGGTKAARIPLKESWMKIEYNASAEDIGVQFFLDSDGWKAVEIRDPAGREIYGAEVDASLLRQGGGTELFLESVEPPIADLPFEEFFERFPEGIYRFYGISPEGQRLTGRDEFTHEVPAGPVIVTPVPDAGEECADDVPLPVLIAWDPVTTSIFGDPVDVVEYELIVESDDVEGHYDVHLPAASGTALTVSMELLLPGASYKFEVLAIEESGNQTITEGCFTTAR